MDVYQFLFQHSSDCCSVDCIIITISSSSIRSNECFRGIHPWLIVPPLERGKKVRRWWGKKQGAKKEKESLCMTVMRCDGLCCCYRHAAFFRSSLALACTSKVSFHLVACNVYRQMISFRIHGKPKWLSSIFRNDDWKGLKFERKRIIHKIAYVPMHCSLY